MQHIHGYKYIVIAILITICPQKDGQAVHSGVLSDDSEASKG